MASKEYKYAPLPDTASSTSIQNRLVDHDDMIPTKKRAAGRFWMLLLVAAILSSNIVTAIVYSTLLQSSSSRYDPAGRAVPVQHVDHPDRAITQQLPTVWSTTSWWTEWGMPDYELDRSNIGTFIHALATNEKWNGIRTDHGIIAVDREWAKQQHWPDSMYLPKDPNGKQKGVYLLEAYHQLHCLRMIRAAFVELINGRNTSQLSHSIVHTSHCFGTLLQHIQCHADNTPLFTYGDRTAGDGQVRQCKSWDALRDFATEHTACYKDGPLDMPLQDHFGYCEEGIPYQDGRDGMP